MYRSKFKTTIGTSIQSLGLAICLSTTLVACDSNTQAPVINTEGQKLVTAHCKVCHASAINGAPILGNPKMWRKRIAQGESILVQHAIDGFGLMPPKGGNTQLSDGQIRLAVQYMISLVQDAAKNP